MILKPAHTTKGEVRIRFGWGGEEKVDRKSKIGEPNNGSVMRVLRLGLVVFS